MEPDVEDVVLKYTELGKYWSNAEDVASTVPYEIFPDDQGSTVDMDTNYSLTSAESYSSLSPRDSPEMLNVGQDECNDNGFESEDEEEDYSMIENPDLLLIQNRYSRENRLANNSRLLAAKIGEMTATLHDIELRSLELSSLDKGTSELATLTEKLLELRSKYHTQFEVIQNLFKAEDVLLAQVTKPKQPVEPCPNNPEIPQEGQEELEPILYPETDQCSTTTDESVTTFETNVTDENEASEDTYRPDEFYECNEFTSDVITGSDESDPEEYTIEEEFECNQRVVLDELKQTLRPVRFDMANREREAYIRTYGNPPPEELEETGILEHNQRDIRRIPRPSRPRDRGDPTDLAHKFRDSYFAQKSLVDVDPVPATLAGPTFQPYPEEDYGDAVVEEDDMKIFPQPSAEGQSNHFLSILQNTIGGRSDRIIGGLSPIYKREKLESESDSD